MKHDIKRSWIFHFKMDSEMKNNLRSLDLYKKEGNLSKLIVKILYLLAGRNKPPSN